MITVFFLIAILFLLNSNNLLLTLIVLELISFSVLYFVSFTLAPSVMSDFIVLSFFAVFVMEGVIALSGLISLVTFTGSDYVSSSSFINF